MCRVKFMAVSGLLAVTLAGLTAYGESIQTFTSYRRDARTVDFQCKSNKGDNVSVKLDVCTPEIIRVRMSPAGDFKQAALIKYGIVNTDWPDVNFTVKDEGDFVGIETGKLTVRVRKLPFKLSFLDKSGAIITEEVDTGITFDRDRGRATEKFQLLPNEHFYGSNARFGHPLDMRGGRVLVRVGEDRVHRGQNRINIPFFMSTNGYGMFFNTTWPQTYKFGTESPDYCSLEVKSNELDYYFIYGPALKDILDRYTDITGKTPLPPKWAFGTWVNTYSKQETALEIARKFRQEGLPADVFRIDSCWMAQDEVTRGDGGNGIGYDALQ